MKKLIYIVCFIGINSFELMGMNQPKPVLYDPVPLGKCPNGSYTTKIDLGTYTQSGSNMILTPGILNIGNTTCNQTPIQSCCVCTYMDWSKWDPALRPTNWEQETQEFKRECESANGNLASRGLCNADNSIFPISGLHDDFTYKPDLKCDSVNFNYSGHGIVQNSLDAVKCLDKLCKISGKVEMDLTRACLTMASGSDIMDWIVKNPPGDNCSWIISGNQNEVGFKGPNDPNGTFSITDIFGRGGNVFMRYPKCSELENQRCTNTFVTAECIDDKSSSNVTGIPKDPGLSSVSCCPDQDEEHHSVFLKGIRDIVLDTTPNTSGVGKYVVDCPKSKMESCSQVVGTDCSPFNVGATAPDGSQLKSTQRTCIGDYGAPVLLSCLPSIECPRRAKDSAGLTYWKAAKWGINSFQSVGYIENDVSKRCEKDAAGAWGNCKPARSRDDCNPSTPNVIDDM